MPKIRSLLLMPLLATLTLACSEQEPTGTAITNVTLIDAINGVRPNQTVIFENDIITAVQPASAEVNAANTYDGTGKYLIPGLWDFHVHLSYDERLTAAMADIFLTWGITSVRDTGGLMENMLPVVRTMRAEDATAPRVFFAGPLLDGEHVVYNGVGRPEIGVPVPTPEDARRIVAELAEQGVDFIKVYEMLTPETFTTLVQTATAAGLPVDSHVPLSMRARTAGPQVQSIEHLRNIEMDCANNAEQLHNTRLEHLANPNNLSGADLRASLHTLQRIPAIQNYAEAECDTVIAALSNTVMVPTLRLNSFALLPAYNSNNNWQAALRGTPPIVQEDWTAQSIARTEQPPTDTRFADWSLFLTGRMHTAGVPVAAGTDTPINLAIPGYSLHEELEMLVRAGLSEMDALEAATLTPAKWFGIDDTLGSIDVGKQADLVLLGDDPLLDIKNTQDIWLVVSKGTVVIEVVITD